MSEICLVTVRWRGHVDGVMRWDLRGGVLGVTSQAGGDKIGRMESGGKFGVEEVGHNGLMPRRDGACRENYFILNPPPPPPRR
jgi:hypothetical protein